MAYWLIKSEPSKDMWNIIEKNGKKGKKLQKSVAGISVNNNNNT